MSGFGHYEYEYNPPRPVVRRAAIATAVARIPMTRDMTDVCYLRRRSLDHERTPPGSRPYGVFLGGAAPWLHDSRVRAAGSHGWRAVSSQHCCTVSSAGLP